MVDKLQALMEIQRRRLDGLKMIRMTDHQAEIISDPHPEILIAGGNRGSKTVCAAVRFAAIARDVPVTTMSNQKIDCRLPHQKNRPLTMWAIGDYLKHIGQVIHRVLFRAGLYYIIKDETTGGWRAWNPVQFPNDWNRLEERRPSPPLIPDSEIDWDNSAWYHRNLRQFEKISLKNGTEIYAFASASEVQQGVPVDEIWVDEQLVNETYYAEYLNRLTDKSGRSVWSTIPRDDSFVYVQVEERAASQKEELEDGHRKPEDVFCTHHILTQRDNPFLPQKQKDMRLEQMSERDRLVRIEGVRSTDVIRIYQTFNAKFHTVVYDDDRWNDQITEELRANNWEPPQDWTRFLALDPGTQKPAVLFTAVPPVHMWQEGEPFFIPYDEIYIPRLDAYKIAAKVRERHDRKFFEEFFIDGQAARQKPMGFSWTIGRQYEMAFEGENLRSRHGTYFTPGDPNFLPRSGLLHKAMRMRKCGWPQLRILTSRCPNLVRQLQTNTRKLDKQGDPTELPADGQKDDVRECLEYTLSRHPTYVEPPVSSVANDSPSMQRYHEYRVRALRETSREPQNNSVLCGARR